MAFGYGVSTPMQTLAFYNAVANNGVLVKPQFVSEIKEWNKTIVKMKEVINPQICSTETLLKLKAVLRMWLKRDRVKTLLKDFSMAGKTGTAQVDYGKDGGSGQYYASL
jgi:cell division protein FtsI (penicillin-binding protein 3)